MSGPENHIPGMQEQGQNTAASTLHLMFRFLRTVRLRSGILVASLVVSCIAGAAYFITAQRIYQSDASLYIVRMGGNVTEESQNSGSSSLGSDMPTFIELISRDEVLVRALRTLPKDARANLGGKSDAQRVGTIKSLEHFIIESVQLIHEFVLLFVFRLVILRVLPVRARTSRR